MRLAIPGKMEGIGYYSYEIARRLILNHPEHQFFLIYDRKVPDFEFHSLEHVQAAHLFPPARRPFLWKYWFNKSVSSYLKKIQADLFLSFDGYLSLNSEIPQISVIHDLNFEHYPEDLPASYAAYFKKYFPKFARIAARIISVSEFSKNDIVELYGIEASKIDVVHNAVKDAFKPVGEAEKTATKTSLSEGGNYMLYIGSIHPRKNIRRMCEAFDVYKERSGSELKLILAGSSMWSEDLNDCTKNLKHRDAIIRCGELPLETLVKLCAAATTLCYLSYFEGFGVPILEGFASEVPVLCANNSALPEVAGDAALMVDPFDTQAIASGMEKINQDQALRSALIEKGRERLKHFSWDASALKIWESIEQVVR